MESQVERLKVFFFGYKCIRWLSRSFNTVPRGTHDLLISLSFIHFVFRPSHLSIYNLQSTILTSKKHALKNVTQCIAINITYETVPHSQTVLLGFRNLGLPENREITLSRSGTDMMNKILVTSEPRHYHIYSNNES